MFCVGKDVVEKPALLQTPWFDDLQSAWDAVKVKAGWNVPELS